MPQIQSVTAQNTPEGVFRIFQSVALQLVGRASSGQLAANVPQELLRGLQLRVGMVLLSKIKQAFLVKAAGGTGEDGIKWPPLSPKTIAQRGTTADERKALGITKGMKFRGLLTADQDKEWRKIFSTRKAWLMLKFGLNERDASARAAQIAWTVLKGQGAKTKLATLGGRSVEILRDTGELLRSFSPGVDGKGEGTILQTPLGKVIVGTNKKPWHQDGIPGRLPARPFWPPDGNLPEAWWNAILEALQQGVAEIVVRILQKAA